MGNLIDRSREVRASEELDAGKLADYLRTTLGITDELTIEQFPGGHSNLTYLLRAGERELVLRRPPFGSRVATAHDMSREYRVLDKLTAHYPYAPAPIAMCSDEAVIGAPFYLMERLTGVIIRRKPSADLDLAPATAAALCSAFLDTMADLHAIDYEAVGLADFGKPEGYTERQVTGWSKRYEGSQTDEIAGVAQVAGWLAGNMPTPQRAGIIHNDLKFDNMVLDPDDITRVVGILDWEMTTIGDPLMDLGTSLSYWVEAGDAQPMQMLAFGPTAAPGMLTRAELVSHYGERTGQDVNAMVFYYVYGLFKTAVVAQQIYYRYQQGLTKDPRFAPFIHAVRILIDQATLTLERDAI